MRRILFVAVAALVVALAAPAMADDAAVAAGKTVFGAAKPACKSCHTDTKNPLAKTGAENTAEELKAWVRTPKEMITKKGKKGMMPAYGPDKITDKDLDALVAYMATMK
jgi:mono/diheme cytochrome c family protein